MKYVLSVMANSVSYTFYHNADAGAVPPVAKKIRVEGGCGIPSSRKIFGNFAEDVATGIPLYTPEGVVTSISDSDYEMLKEHKVFKKHLEAKLVRLVNTDISTDHAAVEKVTRTMARDGFRPLSSRTIGGVKVKLDAR